jgi:hypothetical protein
MSLPFGRKWNISGGPEDNSLDPLFYFAFSSLIAHELDAIHRHEWRLLYVLRTMADSTARNVFVVLHIPLIALILWLIAHDDETVRFYTQVGLDLFMIVHAGLHWRLSGHPKYEFNSMPSQLLIYGTATLALIHLVLLRVIG